MFMLNPGKGGRGRNAPYLTTHYRIPTPIKPIVEKLANAYRVLIGDNDVEGCNNLVERVNLAIAAINEVDKNQLNIYDAIIEKLETDLVIAQEQIEQLKKERENAINILLPALEYKPQQGKKIQEIIRQAYPNSFDK